VSRGSCGERSRTIGRDVQMPETKRLKSFTAGQVWANRRLFDVLHERSLGVVSFVVSLAVSSYTHPPRRKLRSTFRSDDVY
jgi:hypothetical protein